MINLIYTIEEVLIGISKADSRTSKTACYLGRKVHNMEVTKYSGFGRKWCVDILTLGKD